MDPVSLKASICFVALLFANGVLLTEASHIKIHIEPDQSEIRRFERDVSSTACSDRQLLNRSSIELPGMLSMLNQRVRFYRSEYVTRRINCLIESSTVAGLDMVYVTRVLEVLSNEGCTSFPHGGVVRDQFLGKTPNDIDFKVDCDTLLVLEICKREWGEAFCLNMTAANQLFVHIGLPKSEALDFGVSSNEFYGSLRFLEYTVNSLVYWPNRSIILDIAGTGVRDVCAKEIRIPSDENDSAASWEIWIDRENNTRKLYRFWKLRTRNFTPFTDATRDFIVREAQAAIERDTPRGKDFKKFYCSNVYNTTYLAEDNICQVNDSMACIENLSLSALYDKRLREDMGNQYIDGLEIPICSK